MIKIAPQAKNITVIIGVAMVMLVLGIGIGRELPNKAAGPEMRSSIKEAAENLAGGQMSENQGVATVSDDSLAVATNSGSNSGIILGQELPFGPGGETQLVKVTRVIDGDTIEIEGGERVRYLGIDTPETVNPREPVQCFGKEAGLKNQELVKNQEVRLEKDLTDRDKYNRLLRYVWLGQTLVNLELVKRGFAYSYSYPPDVKYQEKFVQAQAQAQEQKRGLWTACPVHSSQPAEVPAAQEQPDSGQCLIKGNISASGEKIYHLLGCGSYEKTKIEENRGERWFCSEAQAQAAGWRKALNCP